MSEEKNISNSPEDEKSESPKERSSSETKSFAKSEGISTEEELQTIHHKLETLPMEVHHHPHTHEKRNWKTYFWEFLMLFLAVFCGFLAEYQLEHKIESDREEIYMKNLLEDLKADTAAYKNYSKATFVRFGIIDSLMYLLKNPERQKNTNKIYFLARKVTMGADMLFANERTYDQMKYSGQLRLIHNQRVSESVSSYYNSLKQIMTQNERIKDRGNHYFLSMDKLFDAEELLKIFKENKEPDDKSLRLLTEDPKVINEFLTRAQYLYGTFYFSQNWGMQSCKTAEDLIELIKKEYHL